MATRAAGRNWCRGCAAIVLAVAALAAGAEVVDIGSPAARSAVPPWDARGLGPLPWQGVACLDVSGDGRLVALGTIAPPGDPNLLLLGESGKLIGQHRAGLRWIGEVAVSNSGECLLAYSTTPLGQAGDSPRLYALRRGKEMARIGPGFRLRDFRAAGFFFHYGSHSNHVARVACRAGEQWIAAGDDRLHWLSPEHDTTAAAHLGQGATTAFAASPGGRVVVGRFAGVGDHAASLPSLLVLEPGSRKPAWTRPIPPDATPSPEPEKGVYGPPVPPYRDVAFRAPLAVAIDRDGEQTAAADYQGWQRVFQPTDGGAEIAFGLRVMPSHPTIHVYDADGKPIRHLGPESFREPFWADLAFSPGGGQLLISPHNWTSRGLAGQPFLPADATARHLYLLTIRTGKLAVARFPDAISSATWVAEGRLAVGCWDGRVYLLGDGLRPVPALAKGMDVGAASLVCAAGDGKRIAVATTAGSVRMLDLNGTQLWHTDLNKAATPGAKPWTKNQKPGQIGPGIWRTNGGMAHSDMGGQYLIEAPQGLILIDPNAGASFEQNWSRIQGAGLDPMQLKYVLLTHEHGDHAPGSYLWRLATGAQVVAGVETAYILQHHLPGGTGYGLHPPNPVDIPITGDRELDLAGLKVKAIHLSGHTYGSMGYVFEKAGRTYAAIGDVIMPGGVLGYSGSLDFSARDVLESLRKLATMRPDEILGGHGSGDPANFVAKGIAAGEATGWSRMTPEKPNPLFRFEQTNYLVAAWLQPIQSAAYGDIDGDDRPDVAVLAARPKGSAVLIHLNKGGKLTDAPDVEIPLPQLTRAWKLRSARINADKVADLLVTSHDQAILLLSEPDRLAFRPMPLGDLPRVTQLLTGDLTGDGRTDLVLGSRFVSGHAIARQNDDGTFRTTRSDAPGRGYFDVQLADVNGDRRDDLIFSSGDVFLRQEDGSLAATPAVRLEPTAGEARGWVFMAAADFDRDGWTDVVLLVAAGDDATSVSLFRNTRNAQKPFGEKPTAAFVVQGARILRDGPTVADWNADGIADLVLCAGGKKGAVVLSGSRADGLSPKRVTRIRLDYSPHYDTRLGVADFNGDGRPDLAGFGPSPVGAVGVYIWLQPPAAAK